MGWFWKLTPVRLEAVQHVGVEIDEDPYEIHPIRLTQEDEQLLITERGDPAHQATWEAFMALLAIRHFVSPTTRGRIILVGDALGMWCGLVRMKAKAAKVNEIAKELALHLAPLGHELIGIHVWSEVNVLADALSRIDDCTSLPTRLREVRREVLSPRGPSEWVCLKTQCECK